MLDLLLLSQIITTIIIIGIIIIGIIIKGIIVIVLIRRTRSVSASSQCLTLNAAMHRAAHARGAPPNPTYILLAIHQAVAGVPS